MFGGRRRGQAHSPRCISGVKRTPALLSSVLRFCKSHILQVAGPQSHRALGFPGCPDTALEAKEHVSPIKPLLRRSNWVIPHPMGTSPRIRGADDQAQHQVQMAREQEFVSCLSPWAPPMTWAGCARETTVPHCPPGCQRAPPRWVQAAPCSPTRPEAGNPNHPLRAKPRSGRERC